MKHNRKDESQKKFEITKAALKHCRDLRRLQEGMDSWLTQGQLGLMFQPQTSDDEMEAVDDMI